MAGKDIDDLDIFKEVCLDDSDAETTGSEDEEDYLHTGGMTRLESPPRERKPSETHKFIDLETYIHEKCENRIKILDRSTFAQIKRPIIIVFNHFREKCYYHTKWLDRLHQLALKFGDRIEFIAADQFVLDLMYPQSNPIEFFCNFLSPEKETPRIYAIDENKRILEYCDVNKLINDHFDVYKTEENLLQLCEKLLNGSLYVSQAVPEKNEAHLVKICVAQNYGEMVTQSTKDILLIVDLGDYHITEEWESKGNYEKIAKQFQNAANLDIVYIDAANNYIHFELDVCYYPKIMFIPHGDKKHYVELQSYRTDNCLIEFIQKNLAPEGDSFRRQQRLAALTYQPFQLPAETEIRFQDFEQYLEKYFPKSMKIFHDIPQKAALGGALIFFMDFRRKGVRYYLKQLQTIHQVAAARPNCSISYILADLQDIAKIFPKWYCKDLLPNDDNNSEEDSSEIFIAIDTQKRKYRFDSSHLKTPSSLFYFYYQLTRSDLFYSQCPQLSNGQLVKPCTAFDIQHIIETSKNDIFLTIYRTNCEKSSQVLRALEDMDSLELTQMTVSLVKMDANLNSVPMEYSWPLYPVHFFIPIEDRDERTRRYVCSNPNKEDILEYIRINKSGD